MHVAGIHGLPPVPHWDASYDMFIVSMIKLHFNELKLDLKL
jgi:hypothetical protein